MRRISCQLLKSVGAVVCCLFLADSGVTQVLSITEVERSGEDHPIILTQFSRPIVDINSSLVIQIDRDYVRRKAGEIFDSRQPIQSEELEAVTQILAAQAEIMGSFGPCLRSREECETILNSVSARLHALFEFVSERKGLRQRANEIFQTYRSPDRYKHIFALAAEEVERATAALRTAVEEQRVYFRLGGWMRNRSGDLRPIHIPNFDSYSDGEFFEAPRFTSLTSEELRSQLEAAREQADLVNQSGIKAAEGFISRSRVLENRVRDVVLCLSNLLRPEALRALSKKDSDILPEIEDSVASIQVQVQQILDGLGELRDLVNQLDYGADLLVTSGDLIIQGINLIETLKAGLDPLKQTTHFTIGLLESQKFKAELEDDLEDFLNEADTCKTDLDSLINDTATWGLEAYGYYFPRVYGDAMKMALEFGEEVKRFLLDDIPESTELDLRNTGARQNGDEILLRCALEDHVTSSDEAPESVELERRRLVMYQVGWHSTMSVGLVFVDQVTSDSIRLKNTFQAAPSCNLVLKHGSRSSLIYNSFWNVGLGLNFASPDLNLDTTPELGIGFVVTTAKDNLQLGVGRHLLGGNAWYWFFGVRFPAGTISVPGVITSDER